MSDEADPRVSVHARELVREVAPALFASAASARRASKGAMTVAREASKAEYKQVSFTVTLDGCADWLVTVRPKVAVRQKKRTE